MEPMPEVRPFYLVWRRPRTGLKTHKLPRRRHLTLFSAQKEAQRLAESFGGNYAVCQCVGVCQGDRNTKTHRWILPDDHEEPEMPDPSAAAA